MNFNVNVQPIGLLATLACSLIATRASAQSYPPVWTNTSSYVSGDMVTDYGNVYRCIKPVISHYLDPSKTYANWELYYVRSSTSVLIGQGQPFPDLATAWTYAKNCHIAEGAYLHLTISSADGPLSENLGNGLNLDHPSGANISIIGDSPGSIVLTSLNGLQLDTGHSIALISGIELKGSKYGMGTGLLVTGNASVGMLSNASITYSAVSIEAIEGGRIHCASSVNLTDFYTAVSATKGGGVVFDPNLVITGTGYVGQCTALSVAWSGYIEAPNVTISQCETAIDCTEDGDAMVHYAQIYLNDYGIVAIEKGHVDAEYSSFGIGSNMDQSVDIQCLTGSTVDVLDSSVQTKSVGTNDGSYINS